MEGAVEGGVEGPQSERLTVSKMLSISQRHRPGTALPSVFYSFVLHADEELFGYRAFFSRVQLLCSFCCAG